MVCFVLLFLYRFSFYLVSDTLFCVFILRVIRNRLRILVLIATLKIVLLKMVMMIIKHWRILIWHFFKCTNLVSFWFRFSFCLVSDNLFCVFVLRVIRNCLKILFLIATLKTVMLKMVMKRWRILIWYFFYTY